MALQNRRRHPLQVTLPGNLSDGKGRVELPDDLEPLLNPLLQLKRIETPPPGVQRVGSRLVSHLTTVSYEALTRRPGDLLMHPDGLAAYTPLRDLLEGRGEAIAPHAPCFQQLENGLDQQVVGEPVVPEQLPHMGRVFLLHVSLVVLVIGP